MIFVIVGYVSCCNCEVKMCLRYNFFAKFAKIFLLFDKNCLFPEFKSLKFLSLITVIIYNHYSNLSHEDLFLTLSSGVRTRTSLFFHALMWKYFFACFKLAKLLFLKYDICHCLEYKIYYWFWFRSSIAWCFSIIKKNNKILFTICDSFSITNVSK